MAFETESWPVIRAKHFRSANRGPGDVRVIVIHDMEAPEKSTTAEAVARYFERGGVVASAHINVDNDSIVQSVYDSDIAYAAPGANHDGIQVEIAGYARQTREQWLDEYSRDALELAANAVAQYCLKFEIPVKHLSDSELAKGHRGIVGHNQVSKVYKRSSHWDPGPNFPWDHFISRVQYWHDKWSGKTTTPGGDDELDLTKEEKEWLEKFARISYADDVQPSSLSYILNRWFRPVREIWGKMFE